MKNKLKLFTFLAIIFSLGVFINSCENDEEIFTATPTDPITLFDLPIATIDLDASNPGNPAVTFNWEEADYGQPAAENYRVVVASDEAFTNPVDATSVSGTTTATLTVNELNSAAGSAGLTAFEFSNLYARVESSIGTQNALPVASNSIVISVRPYFNYEFEDFYLVGNGTAADWNNNNNNPPLFRDAENDNVYRYTGFFSKGGGGFDDGRWKVLEMRGMWQPQWGVTANEGDDIIVGEGDIAGNPVTQDGDPGRFGVPADGYYTFTINFSRPNGTSGEDDFSIEPFDASGATEFTSITFQGSALAENTEMTQLSFDTHIWYINSVSLQPGEVSFNTSAGSTWGTDSAFSGVATEGGSNIPVVVPDDYEVWFNDLTGDYIMIPLNL